MIIYISGPMSGIPDLNFPAFAAAASRLRNIGYTVINPAEIEQPVKEWSACMREDIKQLMLADAVAVLPGWALSKGATIEVNLAGQLGMRILDSELFDLSTEEATPDGLPDSKSQT
jgi:hypothetical protein